MQAPSVPDLPPRQASLLAELRQADGELSGQDLHARLRGGPAAMGLATVYRHLRQLQQRGLVRCRHLPSGEALYAPTERDEHHLTCVDCGSTMVLSHCTRHDRRLKDAASARRQQLAAQLLRGEEVMVAKQGAIRLLS